MPNTTLLNVNVPAGVPDGVEVTSLGKRIYRDELKLDHEDEGPPSRRRYWIYGYDPGFHDVPGTDLAAVAAGRIAVTPIHFDLTDRPGLEALGSFDLEALLARRPVSAHACAGRIGDVSAANVSLFGRRPRSLATASGIGQHATRGGWAIEFLAGRPAHSRGSNWR